MNVLVRNAGLAAIVVALAILPDGCGSASDP